MAARRLCRRRASSWGAGRATEVIVALQWAILNFAGPHSGEGTAARVRDVFHVAILMDGFTVFVRGQIDLKIDRLGANRAGYFRERVATHKRLLWTVARRLKQ